MLISTEERFFRRVLKGDGCWLWQGAKDGCGYGQFRLGDKIVHTHRMVWRLCNGDIPDGLNVLHKCDVPNCVNPLHLFLGTRSDNMMDKERKGRGNHPRGGNHGRSKITDELARAIKYCGLTPQQASLKYGVTDRHARDIQKGRNFKHLI